MATGIDTRTDWRRWTSLTPAVALVVLVATWGREPARS